MEAGAGTLSGRYETGERLGTGGMSNVYKATDRILERTVAVKILAEHLSDDERFVARFRREALAVAKLIHPNIVQVYDTGVDEGRHYIVMEYVEGRSGAQILQRHGPVEPEIAAEIGIQACAGLDYAHRRGIIHRDVKPGNLMIVGGPVGGGEMIVKLTDFGIARAIEQTRITQVGSVVGTAAYLAPEQVRGEEATPATDVYALGVVLYQFLTGRLPYEGSSLAELAVRQQNEKPLPPEHLQQRSAGDARRGGAAGAGGRPEPALRERRRARGRAAAGARRRGRDAAAGRGHRGDPRPRRRDRRDPPHGPRHRPDRVPPGAVADPAAGSRAAAPAPAPPAPQRRAPPQPRKRGAFSRFARFVLAAGRAGAGRRRGGDRGDRHHRQGGRGQGQPRSPATRSTRSSKKSRTWSTTTRNRLARRAVPGALPGWSCVRSWRLQPSQGAAALQRQDAGRRGGRRRRFRPGSRRGRGWSARACR